ncbi:MAG: hypothetical protein ACREAN_07705, partial [Nitrosopumilaceae archaeon]
MEIVDAFCHLYPKEYLKEWISLTDQLVFEHDQATDREIVFDLGTHYPVSFIKFDSTFDTVDIRLKHMAKYG